MRRAVRFGGSGSGAGFTLIEMLISLTVFAVVVTAGLGVYRTQAASFAAGAAEAALTQNLLYASSTIGRELRTAGTNLAQGQPFLVYGDVNVVAFHADYTTNLANDPFAVYHDPDAPAGTVAAPTSRTRVRIPLSSFTYPDTTYRAGGGANSPAELLIFYIEPDTSTSRGDDYVLMKQVNGAAPELIARDLLRLDDGPFLEYVRVVGGAGTGRLVPVPTRTLPLRHSVPIHLAPADTGRVAVIDSVRAVRLRLVSTNGLRGDEERTHAITKMIWLPNAGLQTERSCGSPPLFGGGLAAVARLVDGDPEVELTWARATDEAGGEQDVVRYVMWRRESSQPSAPEPFLSIPAGSNGYSYTDRTVTPGLTYVYSVAAQDCTPSLSSQSTVVVAVPTP